LLPLLRKLGRGPGRSLDLKLAEVERMLKHEDQQ
jgi:hypothetical protein